MFSDYTESGPSLLGDATQKLRGTFRLRNTNVTVANTIRRAILTLTNSVGFRTEPYEKSELVISVNTTPLVNEMISHRIGMIPIKADPAQFDPTLYEFRLDKQNTTKEMMDVHASDIEVFKLDKEKPLEPAVQVSTADFFPPDPITGDTVLITRLRPQWNPTAPNEHLKLKARACVSNGKENIRWSPVCQASYEYTRDPDETHRAEVFHAWVLANKKLDPTTLADEARGELEREFQTMEVQRCFLRDEKGEPNDFTFYVESVGVQSVRSIVLAGLQACEALVTQYQDVDVRLPDNLTFQQGDSRFPSVDAVFANETHSLGNLLETFLVEQNIDGVAEPKLRYVGYKVPHPLRPEMFVRMDVRTSETEEVEAEVQVQRGRAAIANACRQLKAMFQSLQASWTKENLPSN